MVAHGLITGMLFFLAGSVKHRYHTLEITRLSAGCCMQMPKLGWILGFCAMASLGLPGLAGFWGEFPAILSAYNPGFGLSDELFRTLMVHRRPRHGVRRRLPAVALPAHGVRGADARVLRPRHAGPRRRRRRQRRHHGHADIHDVTVIEWIAWTPLLVADRRARRLPADCCSRSSTRPSPTSSSTSGSTSRRDVARP